MKEIYDGSMQSFKKKARQTIIPIIFSTALGITTPFNIDNNTGFEMKTNVAYAENETDLVRYEKLSSEYPRLYNSNYAIPSKEAVQRDEKGHVIATNGVSITHKYNEDTGKWSKLDENLPYASPEVRMKYTLNSLLKMNYFVNKPDGSQDILTNPLNISEDDVDKYLKTNSDKDLKSFQVIGNSKGEPSLILITNLSSGLHEGNNSVQGIKKAFDFLNKIDPTLVDKISQQFYVRAISGDFADTGIRRREYESASMPTLNTICLNGDLVRNNYLSYAFSLINQSRSVYLWKHIAVREGKHESYVTDRLNDNNYLDRLTFTKMIIEQSKSKMSKHEYETITLYLTRTIENYYKSKYK